MDDELIADLIASIEAACTDGGGQLLVANFVSEIESLLRRHEPRYVVVEAHVIVCHLRERLQ